MHFLEGGGDEADEIDKLKSEEEEISTQHVVIANHSDMKQQDPLIQEFIHAQVCKKNLMLLTLPFLYQTIHVRLKCENRHGVGQQTNKQEECKVKE